MERSRVILWFRHGLRLHDNPALRAALQRASQDQRIELYPIFIFDGVTAGTKICGYNRFQFLLECLNDLDGQLRRHGGRLHIFGGDPISVFSELKQLVGFEKLVFEQDCEPVWKDRDQKVQRWCQDNGVEWVEKVGHTLYDPYKILEVNGGKPPVTFSIFSHLIECMDLPPRPLPNVDLAQVNLAHFPQSVTTQQGYLDGE